MQAVVMAGGLGTRLRPLTTSLPKPLLPVVGRPMLEHMLHLLRDHGVTDVVITVQYLATMVRSYVGDGRELGIRVRYATEHHPLGTAGGVRAVAPLLDGDVLVVSGDALTDMDLGDLMARHTASRAALTMCLTSRSDPREFGAAEIADDGRVVRFVEKPAWGEVFTDRVSTGIYVVSPGVIETIPPDTRIDWAAEVIPALIAQGADVRGHVVDGYWEDVGDLAAYRRVQADALTGAVRLRIPGFEVSDSVWVGEGAEVAPEAEVTGPVYIGPHTRIEAGARITAGSVIGSNVVVRGGAVIERAILHDNVYVGEEALLRGCVIGRGTEVLASVQVAEGAAIADDCTLEQEVVVAPGALIYPGKVLEAGVRVDGSVVWETRAHRHLFGPRGVSGLVNVEITPEIVVRLAAALASTLPKGAVVSVGRDHSRAARSFNRALIGGLTAAGMIVRDLRTSPMPVLRSDVVNRAVAGVMLRTTSERPESLDIVVLDRDGQDLGSLSARTIERIYERREFRRPFPGEIGDITTPNRAVDDYSDGVLRSVNTDGIPRAGTSSDGRRVKVVVDVSGGAAALVLPTLLGDIDVDLLMLHARLDESRPTDTPAQRATALSDLGAVVASSRAAFGVSIDQTGERLALIDETGRVLDDERAALVVADLVAAEQRRGTIVLPATTSRVAERIGAFHGVGIHRVAGVPNARIGPDCLLAADGAGGFVMSDIGVGADALATTVALIGLVARTHLTLSAIDARLPVTSRMRLDVPTAWSDKAAVMRAVHAAAQGHQMDLTEGVRVIEPDGAWCLVRPDPDEALTNLWVEAANDARASGVAQRWRRIVEAAGT